MERLTESPEEQFSVTMFSRMRFSPLCVRNAVLIQRQEMRRNPMSSQTLKNPVWDSCSSSVIRIEYLS